MSNPEQSVIDQIDALIDEQLDAGEPIGGYDYNDPDFPKCGRCGWEWHGLPDHGCLGVNEGPETPPCPHCGQRWHTETLAPLRTCEGSTFIGPRRPTAFEEPRDADGYLPNVAREYQFPQTTRSPLLDALLRMQLLPLWDLPDNPFDISQYGPAPTRAPRPTFDEQISTLLAMSGDLAFTHRRWLTGDPPPEARGFARGLHGRPYDYGGGHEITHSFIDEIGRLDAWPNPWLPANPFENKPDPRPWRWVPRTRVIPAYTIEPGATIKTWDGDFNCTGEIRELRITGTRPELVDATMDTPGPIPRWATDPEQLRWALTHPTIPDGRPYTYGRDFHIGVGSRIGWDNGNGQIWIGTVTEQPREHRGSWTITVGENDANHIPPEITSASTTEQPPMWTVNPGRERRRNTRRRHR
ncbi:hypothetical protein [Rhodococcoides fascians]|uniref:hypothetical protein n=1 Tax=Rhodococcoides fascians TaxID=1828 RepID=UPI00056A68F9|nr:MULTISPECIES: hypothetical protein [Rhodococcus]OZE98095.1 hypothetical protein CH301_17280 [Rhodococcus sp. 15-1189-1-1a]OZF12745.1 hypothetical protein CH299_17965 [Rhodococcus sp. 14-2686-1-2]